MPPSSSVQVLRSPIEVIDDRLGGRWRIAVGLGILLGAVFGVLGYLAAPVWYQSSGSIHVAPTGTAILRETSDTEAMRGYSGMIVTQAILLNSPSVIDEALKDPEVQSLEIAQGPGARERIMSRLIAEAVRGSELINVPFESQSPETAYHVVNAVLLAYNRLHGKEGSEFRGHRSEKLEESRAELRAEREAKRRAIQEYVAQSEYGSGDLQQVLERKLLLIEDLKQQIQRLELLVGDRSPGSQLTESEADDTRRDPTPEELDAFDPDLARERPQLQDMELQLIRVAEKYSPTHRFYLDLEDEVSFLRRTLVDHENATRTRWMATGGVTTENDGNNAIPPDQIPVRLERLRAMLATNQQEVRALHEEQQQLQDLEHELSDIEERLGEVEEAIRLLRIESDAQFAGRIAIAEMGSIPLSPSKDRRVPMAVAGFGLGMGLSLALFFLVGTLDQRAFNVRQLDQRSGRYRCLGVLPDLGHGQFNAEQSETAAHCVHNIRNRIEALRDRDDSFMLIVTSPYQGDGKTSLAMGLGWSYAAAGHRTLLVDCDFIGRSLSWQLGAQGPGLKEVLRDGRLDDQIISLPVPNLSVLGAGLDPSFGAEAIRRDVFGNLASELRQQYETIIVDTGPFIGSVEVFPVAASSDGVILSMRRGRSRAGLQKCLDDLETVHLRLFGVVLNCANQSDCERYVSKSTVSVRHDRDANSMKAASENALVRAVGRARQLEG